MPYHPVDVPSGTNPTLERMVRESIDPVLRDVHAMLMLPMSEVPGLDAGCNFSCAQVLLGVVSGVAGALYDDSTVAGVDKRENPGEAFKRVIANHYPWNDEPDAPGTIRSQHAAKILYDAFRNPFSHSLGTVTPDESRSHGIRKVAKSPMSDSDITSIEKTGIVRPKFGRKFLSPNSC